MKKMMIVVETNAVQNEYLIKRTPPVFYAGSALWDSFPKIILLEGSTYWDPYLLLLEKKGRESDTEGTMDKKT